jgi:hypothetical protein
LRPEVIEIAAADEEMRIMREAVAVFDDPERLERAVSDLQSRGVDRADLSFLANEALTECRNDEVPRFGG